MGKESRAVFIMFAFPRCGAYFELRRLVLIAILNTRNFSTMLSLIAQFGVLILSVSWIIQFWFHANPHADSKEAFIHRRRKFRSCLRWIWWIAVCAVGVSALYGIVYQYRTWSSDPLAQYFLPPYKSITYFISYSGTRHAANPLIAVATAILFGSLAMRLNLKFQERFFEEEEPRLFALGILLSGYPGLLFYILFMFIAGVAFTLWYAITKRGRAPFYFLWLPMAIFAILITNFTLSHRTLALFNL